MYVNRVVQRDDDEHDRIRDLTIHAFYLLKYSNNKKRNKQKI